MKLSLRESTDLSHAEGRLPSQQFEALSQHKSPHMRMQYVLFRFKQAAAELPRYVRGDARPAGWLACPAAQPRPPRLSSSGQAPAPVLCSACAPMRDSAMKAYTAYTVCRRIACTPLPFAYITHLRSFLLFWLAILPWFMVSEYYWLAIIWCTLIG